MLSTAPGVLTVAGRVRVGLQEWPAGLGAWSGLS